MIVFLIFLSSLAAFIFFFTMAYMEWTSDHRHAWAILSLVIAAGIVINFWILLNWLSDHQLGP